MSVVSPLLRLQRWLEKFPKLIGELAWYGLGGAVTQIIWFVLVPILA